MSRQSKQQPAHEIRLGAIKGTIWENQTESGIRYSTSIARLYKDGDQWKQTTSFNRDDLPLVSKVADMIHTWIFESVKTSSTY